MDDALSRGLLPTLIVLFASAGMALAERGDILETFERAGQKIERLEWPESEHGYIEISYPKDFDPKKAYHLLYWFHGTSGKPNPGIANAHPAYIGVGMSYLKQEHTPPGTYGAKHWNECRAARAILESRGLLLRRNVIAGMSLGGWSVFYIAAEPREGLHGAAIFGAGKDARIKNPPNLEGRGLSVLIGTGETDPNYPHAQLGISFFRTAGADVNYTEFLGEGHTYRSTDPVVSWLEVESRKDIPALLEQSCATEITQHLATAQAHPTPLERYVALRLLLRDPRTRHAGETLRAQALAAGKLQAEDETVQNWLEELNQLRALVAKEAEFFDTLQFDAAALESLVAKFREFATTFQSPDLACRAAFGYKRAKKMFELYTAQEHSRNDPEYLGLKQELDTLQKEYARPGQSKREELEKQIEIANTKLNEWRFNASMNAFYQIEWNKEQPEMLDEEIQKAMAFDATNPKAPKPLSGLGF